MDVVTVGDLMLDVRVDARRLVRGGDAHGRVLLRPGGSAANAAVWASAAGARARVHGRVGGDLAGQLLVNAIADRGVDPALVRDPGAETGTMLVVYEAGERSMIADRGANAGLHPDDLPERIEAGAVLVSGYTLLQEGSASAGAAALARARARYIAVDTASWPLVEAFGADAFLEATANVNVLFANEREAAALSGEEGEDAAHTLGRRYPVVAVKLGERGAVLWWQGLLVRNATDGVEEIDPTGAGDAFDGVFLAALVAGASPGDALAAACRAGASVAGSTETWPDLIQA